MRNIMLQQQNFILCFFVSNVAKLPYKMSLNTENSSVVKFSLISSKTCYVSRDELGKYNQLQKIKRHNAKAECMYR